MYALFVRRGRCVAAVIAFLAGESAGAQPPAPLPLATNFAQLRQLTDSGHTVFCEVHIQGIVCAVSPDKRVVALQDDSGAAVIEMDFQAPSLVPGQIISLRASRCAVNRRGLDLAPGPGPVLDNDGWHGAAGRGIDSFEVLIHSPLDIVILEQPPWWTPKTLYTALGMMTLILLGAMLWVWTLRQRVEVQTKIIREKVQREATLEERTRIAREVHDTLEQALAGISLQLNGLTAIWTSAPAEARQIINMARSMVRHGQDEARRTVYNLRQLAFEGSDLPTAFSKMATQTGDGSQPSVEVRIAGTPAALPAKLESHLLRIGQEATTNALKHAGASHIRLEFRYDQNSVQLAVSDDGCGFDAQSARPSDAGHFGLLGMRERAEKIGGRLKITSDARTGTVVEVFVPLPGTGSSPLET